ncbi:MAG: hypothetical protein D3903_08150 [Candidatus Electrothrix sp. GM3_4]|nr:hypothetical protein [Candidatus Electrothrix sp. GM3_4]
MFLPDLDWLLCWFLCSGRFVLLTPERLELAQEEGQTVVMVFTAEWCLNCKVLERGILESPKIVKLLTDERVLPMKVDITGNNPEGKAKLKEVGSLTIPLLVVVDADEKQVYKSDFYTANQSFIRRCREPWSKPFTSLSGEDIRAIRASPLHCVLPILSLIGTATLRVPV